MNNIILIGFMGVGKGRTARALSRVTGRFAIDTDDLIESLTGKKIREIFSGQGEARFREMERRVAEWIITCVRDTIVSTGGGFFQVEQIRRMGQVVYLHAEVEQILERLLSYPGAEKEVKKRPLLKDIDKARDLFQKRLPRYRAVADFEVDVAEKEPETIARQVWQLIQDNQWSS
ncbi:MAG: shikimate kinase [Desulfobulbus propionicus]|nr:MAG: shikimate kinase [Desulfobulbus propionicus]